MKKVNISEKFTKVSDYWSPKILGNLNNHSVKIAKFKGEFVWHKHDNEDEMFLVIKGHLIIQFRDQIVHVHENEFIIVPKGVEHKPIAKDEVHVMLIEPITTLNTGNVLNKLTKKNINRL